MAGFSPSSLFAFLRTKTKSRSIKVQKENKMAGYWPSSLFAFLWSKTKLRSIKRPISSHLDRNSLVNKRFIIWHKEH